MAESHDEGTYVQAWLRPLAMPSIQVIPQEPPSSSPAPAEVLRDLIHGDPVSIEAAVQGIRSRYLRISTVALDVPAVPAEGRILDRLVWQLKSAKQSFCLGDFVGCISLAGMVSEMTIVFLFDLAREAYDLSALSCDDRELLQSREYEDLHQQQRVKRLRKLGVISQDAADTANRIRCIRREYLHLLSKDFSELERDAESAYSDALSIVRMATGISVGEGGRGALPELLQHYLSRTRCVSVETSA